MSGGHSILPPSGAAAWEQCPMWVTMNKLYPKEDTPESLEGNAAHLVAWDIIGGKKVSEGDTTANGQIVTNEMLDGAELLQDTILSRFSADQLLNMRIEKQVAIPRVHALCFGTLDIGTHASNLSSIEIIDYKFGHRFVDEFENLQCVAYAAGMLDELANGHGVGLLDQAIVINITIVQPRCFYKGAPVRTWSIRGSELRGLINKLSYAAELALQPNPIAKTNSECGDCPGRHACPSLQRAAYADAEVSTRSTPIDLPPAAASLELSMLERSLARLQSRVEGLRESVLDHLKKGHVVPYHKIESANSRQQWNIPTEQVIAIGEMMKINLAKSAAVTPKQALSAGIDPAVISMYSTKPTGALRLVSENNTEARKVFGIKTKEN